MRFAPEAALLAMDDRSFWDTLEEEDSGSILVAFSVPSLEWATRTVLSYAPHAVVLEPEALRQLVAEQAHACAAKHTAGRPCEPSDTRL
jgi:predicted DNA-binding transcriptional regulator YafY